MVHSCSTGVVPHVLNICAVRLNFQLRWSQRLEAIFKMGLAATARITSWTYHGSTETERAQPVVVGTLK